VIHYTRRPVTPPYGTAPWLQHAEADRLTCIFLVHGTRKSAARSSPLAVLWPVAPPGHGTAQRYIAVRKFREVLRTATGQHEAMFVTLSSDRYRL